MNLTLKKASKLWKSVQFGVICLQGMTCTSVKIKYQAVLINKQLYFDSYIISVHIIYIK